MPVHDAHFSQCPTCRQALRHAASCPLCGQRCCRWQCYNAHLGAHRSAEQPRRPDAAPAGAHGPARQPPTAPAHSRM